MGSKRYDSEWREVQVINGYAVLMAYSSYVFRGIGFLVVTWNTVVLLGGFVSMIHKFHFWSLALITLVEILWINASFNETFGSFGDLLSSLSTVNSVLKRKWPLVDNDPKPRREQVVQVVLVVVGWVLAPLHLLVSYMCIISVGCLMVFGMVISTLISVIGLRNLHYYGDAEEERANLDPACNIAYFLCLIQSALLLHLLILRFSQTLIVKQVSRAYGFPSGRAVEGYLHAMRAGCLKKPASATGRNLITYAIELMQSKESDSCLAGTLILERLLVQDGTTSTTTLHSVLSKEKVVAGQRHHRSKDNSGALLNIYIQVKEPAKMVIIEQQRRLIKKLIGSAGYTHILQKLLETLDWRSPDDREMRVAAARIVEHVATGGGIRLEQFPRGIQCISSLLSTFHESDWSSSSLVSNADNTNQLQRYRDLVLTGLRILWSLASSDDNFTVMSNTKHLLSKIMAHVSHDRVHRSDHGEWYSNVVEESLKVMLRFVTAEGENAVELRRQISSSHSAMATMETIVKCEECKGGELQMNAMQILAHLRMVKTESRGNQTEMLVDIFTNGRDSSIRRTAGKTLVMLFLGSTSVATTLSEAGAGFVDSLVKILLQVGDSETSCRQSAAQILEHLCVHYDENDGSFSALKKAMTDVMPKVLRQILIGCGSKGKYENPGYVRPETVVASGSKTKRRKRQEEKEKKKIREKNAASSSHQNKHHKLHVALLSLCVTACDKLDLDINSISPGDGDEGDKGEGVPFRFAMKMAQLNNGLVTLDCLAMMKLTIRMVIAAMLKHRGVPATKEDWYGFSPASLEGLMGALASVTETLIDLESFMFFPTAAAPAAAKTMNDIVEEAKCSMVSATAKTPDAVLEDAKTLDALMEEAQKLHGELKEQYQTS